MAFAGYPGAADEQERRGHEAGHGRTGPFGPSEWVERRSHATDLLVIVALREAALTSEKHLIDETARVFCGVRGKDIDIEICLACRHLEKYDLDSRRPYLVCKGAEEARLARMATEA